MRKNKVKVLFVTTGDGDGIGLEVFSKSIIKTLIPKHYRLIFFTSSKTPPLEYRRCLKRILRNFKVVTCHHLYDALDVSLIGGKTLIEVHSLQSPARWVESVAKICHQFPDQFGLVTAPLSKPEIKAAGMKEIGHTEILKKVSGAKSALMGFYGAHFNLVLATGHIPLSQVPQNVSAQCLQGAVHAALELRKSLAPAERRKPIGILGLNPHSGDKGLIGLEEMSWMSRWIQKRGRGIRGPLVPDSAFTPSHLRKYSVFVALYHDQGLIPFKTLHGHGSGVHRTLGIPFIRTSVDHGTAKDIFGKNIADASSMREAIALAIKLLNSRG
ncbi:MAG: 4-hydroxythreonine-4-phosphate dehydrogenase PdxA [Proteobacteria bacterium]|jgi:4-hydroxythreonine-4-phosphate dehydrogenase|nr:4-hydroxythreonine-4-phosphate dehydrogenase PdxA [Pseudomonadota bacterium]